MKNGLLLSCSAGIADLSYEEYCSCASFLDDEDEGMVGIELIIDGDCLLCDHYSCRC
jgi:hypothetical protein